MKKKSNDPSRLGFVDDTRGIAVVLMILWHTVDSWIEPALKAGQGYDVLRILGGLAAPMFLTLAGAGAVLKIAGDAERGKPRGPTLLELTCRGLEVVVAGYALRVFMWVVDAGAITHLGLLPAYGPLAVGLAILYVALGRVTSRKPHAFPWLLVGAAIWAIGWWQVSVIRPEMLIRVGRVDVPQTIGMSLVLTACTEPLVGYAKRPYLGLVLGLVVASVTGWVEQALPGSLHPCIAGYLGTWPDGVGPTVARFPLFPWSGFGACGPSVGVAGLRGARAGRTATWVLGLAGIGAVMGLLTRETTPWTFAFVEQVPELSRTVRMLQKMGFGLALSGVSFALTQRLSRYPLRTLGVTSMFNYCPHIELVYGMASRGIARTLDYAQWALGFVLLTLLMALAAEARVRLPLAFAERKKRERAASGET